MHHLLACRIDRPDWHDEWINNDVFTRDSVIGGTLNNHLGNIETHVGIFGYTGLIVGNCDDRGTVFLDEWQDDFEALFFSRHRVH